MTYRTREKKEMMKKVTYCSTERSHEATLAKLIIVLVLQKAISVVEAVFPSLT